LTSKISRKYTKGKNFFDAKDTVNIDVSKKKNRELNVYSFG
jgi:hypothetical protein